MSKIIIYHNNRCGKSRGALEILQACGLEFEIRNYLQDPLNITELRVLLKKLKLQPSQLVRTNEDLYKEQYKDMEITETEWLSILKKNPILIERPIVEKDRKAIIARPPEVIYEFLNIPHNPL